MSARNRIFRELRTMQSEPLPNVAAGPIDEDLLTWRGVIVGPAGTPYENGQFDLRIQFPSDYPFKPPKLQFLTQIYHPNINSRGLICLDILQKQWSPALTISKVLLSLTSLLSEPNPDDPLVGDIGRQYKTNYREFFKNRHCAASNSSSSDGTDSSMFDDMWNSESDRQTSEACPAISGSRLRSLFSKDTTDKVSSSRQLDVSSINQGDCGSSVGSGESDNEDNVCSPETRQRFLTEFRNRLSRLKQLTQPQTSSLTDPDRLKQLNQRLQEIVQRNIALQKDEMDKFWVDLNVRIPKREPATADQFGVGQLSATKGKGGAVKRSSSNVELFLNMN
uniref:E2 ubiquitin-conjugating enzyme n=1 Tax=Macrostomum lignano TaxID=282301 RepID=A0A1I8H1R5_9PLAT